MHEEPMPPRSFQIHDRIHIGPNKANAWLSANKGDPDLSLEILECGEEHEAIAQGPRSNDQDARHIRSLPRRRGHHQDDAVLLTGVEEGMAGPGGDPYRVPRLNIPDLIVHPHFSGSAQDEVDLLHGVYMGLDLLAGLETGNGQKSDFL